VVAGPKKSANNRAIQHVIVSGWITLLIALQAPENGLFGVVTNTAMPGRCRLIFSVSGRRSAARFAGELSIGTAHKKTSQLAGFFVSGTDGELTGKTCG
jgi:hypothetical protein